jgi:hypothetical protein
MIVARSLFRTAVLWLVYLALEPYVRKLWPKALISWSRILAGRFRDPMVGRDILAGVTLGLLITVLSHSGRFLVAWMGIPDPKPVLSRLSKIGFVNPPVAASCVCRRTL